MEHELWSEFLDRTEVKKRWYTTVLKPFLYLHLKIPTKWEDLLVDKNNVNYSVPICVHISKTEMLRLFFLTCFFRRKLKSSGWWVIFLIIIINPYLKHIAIELHQPDSWTVRRTFFCISWRHNISFDKRIFSTLKHHGLDIMNRIIFIINLSLEHKNVEYW